MSDTRTRMFVFLVLFWIGIIAISNVFHISILVNGKLEEVTGIELLFTALTFQHTEQLPYFFGIILYVMGIFSIYIAYTLFSPLD